jgi:hypothetical protein
MITMFDATFATQTMMFTPFWMQLLPEDLSLISARNLLFIVSKKTIDAELALQGFFTSKIFTYTIQAVEYTVKTVR